jgi:putative transposase
MRLAMWQLLKLLMIFLRCLPAFFRTRGKQAIVELALRQQLATYSQKGRRPRITPADRGFWVLNRECGRDGKKISSSSSPTPWSAGIARAFGSTGDRSRSTDLLADPVCSPPIPVEVQALIRRFANENGWRTRKVQAELAKLGISVGLATVSRYLPMRDPDRDQQQRWKTFLRNHKHGIAAMDFLVVPTARFRLLYAWFVIGHGRREIIHFGVTEHPTSSWVVQHLREAFPNDTSPQFLIFDNDSIFSEQVPETIRTLCP